MPSVTRSWREASDRRPAILDIERLGLSFHSKGTQRPDRTRLTGEDRGCSEHSWTLPDGGDEEAFTDLARAVGDRLMAIAFTICATSIEPKTRSNKPSSRPGASCPRCVTTTGSMPVCGGLCPRVLRGGTEGVASAVARILPVDLSDGRDDIKGVVDRDSLERGFRRLSPEQSAIFVLHHYVGLTLPEVADELGVPLGTVKSRLHYATNALRAALDADSRPAIRRSIWHDDRP